MSAYYIRLFMYVLNIIFPLLLYPTLKLLNLSRRSRDISFLTFSFLYIVIFLSFFHFQTFPDIETYNWHYNFLVDNTIVDFYSYHGGYILEFGFVLFNKILTFINAEPRTLYIVRSIIFTSCIIYVIKKHSTNYFLSIVFFFLCFGINQSIFVVRQYLALSIFLLSINSILNKKIFRFLFIWSISFSIHASMIIFLPLYWICNYFPLKKGYLFPLFFIGLIASWGIKSAFNVLSLKYGYYEAYLLLSDNEGTSVGMAIRAVAIFLPFLFFCHKKICESAYGKLLFWTGLLNVVFAISIIGIPSGSRLFTNYNAFIILTIPYIAFSIGIKNTRYICLGLLFLFYVLLYFSKLSVYNYYFMWQQCDEFYSY